MQLFQSHIFAQIRNLLLSEVLAIHELFYPPIDGADRALHGQTFGQVGVRCTVSDRQSVQNRSRGGDLLELFGASQTQGNSLWRAAPQRQRSVHKQARWSIFSSDLGNVGKFALQ